MQVSRLDFGTLTRPQKTDQGYLKAPCFATRAGIFLYRNDDGSMRRELRLPDEVFSAVSLATLSGIPITDDHPPVMLDAINTNVFAKGFTGEFVQRVDDLIEVPITITAQDLIASVLTREKVETSCGYKCDLDETPGVWNGQPYDAIQRNIRYNHLAIVRKGRAGNQVRIRMDSGAIQVIDHLSQEFCMTKLRIDELDFELSEPAAIAVSAKLKKDAMTIEEISAQVAALQAEIEKLKGEKEGMTIEMDACKSEMEKVKTDAEAAKMDSAKIHSEAMVRVSLIKTAEKAIPSIKLDSLSNKEIKVEVIKARKPDFVSGDKTDAFIDGLFEGISQFESRLDGVENAINATKGTPPSNVDARAKSMDNDKNAWKSK